MKNSIKSRFTSGKTIFSIIIVCVISVQISNAQWVQVSNGMGNQRVWSLACSGNNIFAGTDTGVYLSTNNGTSWSQTSFNNRSIRSLSISGNNVFAGTTTYGVYLSVNNGTNWSQTSLNNVSVWALAVSGNNIFAGTQVNGVYLSTDNGLSWNQTALNNRHVYSLAVNGNNIFAGTFAYGVYLSTDNGASWTQTAFNNRNVWCLAVNGNNIFAGTPDLTSLDGVYLSTNNGTSWSLTSLYNRKIWSLAISGNSVFAGTGSGYGVYVSTNNGTSWTQSNEGLTTQAIRAFCILNNYIFAGTEPDGVWRRPLSELTGIQPVSNEMPNQFSLSQNYPNPFNPNTKTSFSIPKSSFTILVIYDATGREVTTLVNEQLNPGTYEVTWDASKNPSGVYYYKITAGSFTETRKMILIK